MSPSFEDKGSFFFVGRQFEKTDKAKEIREQTPEQTRAPMLGTGSMWRKWGFRDRARFLSFSHWWGQGELNRSHSLRKEESKVWSSFAHGADVELILSFENPEIVIFLSNSGSNRDRVVTGLTANCEYVHCLASFVPEVSRPTFL